MLLDLYKIFVAKEHVLNPILLLKIDIKINARIELIDGSN